MSSLFLVSSLLFENPRVVMWFQLENNGRTLAFHFICIPLRSVFKEYSNSSQCDSYAPPAVFGHHRIYRPGVKPVRQLPLKALQRKDGSLECTASL